MSTFFGLDIARKALAVSQKALDVTGHNISNANTPGYTRQRLIVASVEPTGGSSRFAVSERGATGQGVVPVTVDQIRSPFLDRQFYRENSRVGDLATRAEHLTYVERLFDELSDTGLSQSFDQFSASLQEASKNPVNKEFRTNLLQNALKLTETFHHYTAQLRDKTADLDHSLRIQAGQVNDLAQGIADCNSQIARYELSGQKANDLRDKRNALIDQLSGLIDITTRENESGVLQIHTGDRLLVDHAQANRLAAIPDLTDPVTGTANALHRLAWASDNSSLQPAGGSLKALIDLRDGDTTEQLGIPAIHHQLDRLAGALATTFNQVHQAGWGLPDQENGLMSETGVPFFAGSTAASLSIHPLVLDNLNRIALSSEPVTGAPQAGNNRNALVLTALFSDRQIPDIGSYAGYLGSFVSGLAVECAHVEKRLEGQKLLIDSIDQQRQSVSSVSMDEEMTRMIRFEKSYAAAARMITTIDEMLDVLINRTGLVGR